MRLSNAPDQTTLCQWLLTLPVLSPLLLHPQKAAASDGPYDQSIVLFARHVFADVLDAAVHVRMFPLPLPAVVSGCLSMRIDRHVHALHALCWDQTL